MLGAIIGDVAGSRFEFHNRKTKDFRIFHEDCRFTDDTVMTLAVAAALMDARGGACPGSTGTGLPASSMDGSAGASSIDGLASASSMDGSAGARRADGLGRMGVPAGSEIAIPAGGMRSLAGPEEKQRLFVLHMQRLGRAHYDAGYGRRFRAWLMEDDPRPYGSWGNGSAMRVSPCGEMARSLGEAASLARQSAVVTHDHPEGIKGAEAVATAIFLARSGRSKEEIREHVCRYYYDMDPDHFTLDKIRPGYHFDVSCQGSVPQALQAFFEAESFEDTIRNAVSLGGDSDTIAAIAGGLAESYYGLEETMAGQVLKYLTPDLREIVDQWYGW